MFVNPIYTPVQHPPPQSDMTEAAYDLCSSRHCNICLLLSSKRNKLVIVTPTESSSSSSSSSSSLSFSASLTPPLLSPSQLQKCTGCQLVQYCGTTHQKFDWPLHRDFCVAAQRITSTYQVWHPFLAGGEPADATQMERATLQVKYLLRTALARPLNSHEEELTSFPEHCAVCYTFQKKLKSCRLCRAVSYCGEQHASRDLARHQRNCNFLQLVYCAYKVQPMPADMVCEFYRRVYDLSKTDLMSAFEHATLKRLPSMPTKSLAMYQRFATAADFSCISTICCALEFVKMSSYANTKFVIFVVGTTIERQLWFRTIHTKFFFLQYSQITHLELYFIGPEAVCDNCPNKTEVYTLQGVDRHISYSSYRLPFEQFCTKYDIKPSLIVAFNCGFSEHSYRINASVQTEMSKTQNLVSDAWTPGLRAMLQTYDLPIVFTSFTRLEAEFDYGALVRIAHTDQLEVHVERICSIKQNPYRDLRPLRNWHLSDKDEIYYRNGYVQVVRTKLEL